MGSAEIREKLDDLRGRLDHAGKLVRSLEPILKIKGLADLVPFLAGASQVADEARDMIDAEDDAEDGDEADAEMPIGPGFVCLPVEAHDRLREAGWREEQLREELETLGRQHEASDQQWRRRYERLQAERAGPVRSPLGPIIASDPFAREQIAGLRAELGNLKGLVEAEIDQRKLYTDTFTARLGEHAGELRKLHGLIEEVCKQHRHMNDRLDATAGDVEAHHSHIVAIDERINDVEDEIEGLPKGAFPEGQALAGFKARVDEQADRLHGFIARMNDLEARVVEHEKRTYALEGERIEALEGGHEKRIKALEDELDALPDLAAHKAEVRRLQVAIDGLEDADRSIRGEVRGLQAGLATLARQVEDQPGRVEAIKARVNRLEVRVPPLEPIDEATFEASPA